MVSRNEIIADIRRQIEVGILRPGSRLPSTAKLMEIYKVGQSTVFNAMQALMHAGYVTTVHGGARYVTGEPRSERTVDLTPFKKPPNP